MDATTAVAGGQLFQMTTVFRIIVHELKAFNYLFHFLTIGNIL